MVRTNYKAPRYVVFSTHLLPCFVPLKPKYLPQHNILKTPSACVPFSV